MRAWRSCACSWYADLRVDGVRRYVPLGPDHTQARARHAQLVADRESGRLTVARGRATFGDAAERWLARLEREGARPSSMRTYRARVGRLARWFGLNTPLAGISAAEVAGWREVAQAKAAPNTVSALDATLRGILRQAVDEGYLDASPVNGAPPRRRREARAERMSLPEAERVLGALEGDVRELAELVLLTGLRIGEALALTAADLEGGVLHVRRTLDTTSGRTGPPKTLRSARAVVLSPRARALLEARGKEGRLFCLTYWRCAAELRRAYEAAGLRRPSRLWHELRHLNITLRERAGMPLRQVAAELGHGPNLAQTLAYGEAMPADAAERLDAARHHWRGGE